MTEKCPFDPSAFNEHFDHHNHVFGLEREAIFDDLRSRCPIHRTDAWGGYVVLSRYDDIREACRDDGVFSSEGGITVPGAPAGQFLRLPISVDPPRSFLYRNVLMRFFRASWLETLKPFVSDLVSGLIDDFIEAGEADLQVQLSHPLTAHFIMHVTGLPREQWFEYSAPVIYSVGSRRDDRLVPERATTTKLLSDEIDRQRCHPRGAPDEKVLPYLLNVEIEGRKLTHAEILAIMELLLDGGFDTTLSAIGHSLVYLARNPDKRQLLIDQPDLMPAAVEEFLRWVTPQQGLFRTATRDAEIGGQQIKQGEKVFLAWPAGNHDPEMFPDPHEVRFDRPVPNRHLAFGVGAHLCLGLNVARLEMRVAFEQVLKRLPSYQVDYDGIVRPPGLGIVNGMEHLPVSFASGLRAAA